MQLIIFFQSNQNLTRKSTCIATENEEISFIRQYNKAYAKKIKIWKIVLNNHNQWPHFVILLFF